MAAPLFSNLTGFLISEGNNGWLIPYENQSARWRCRPALTITNRYARDFCLGRIDESKGKGKTGGSMPQTHQ